MNLGIYLVFNTRWSSKRVVYPDIFASTMILFLIQMILQEIVRSILMCLIGWILCPFVLVLLHPSNYVVMRCSPIRFEVVENKHLDTQNYSALYVRLSRSTCILLVREKDGVQWWINYSVLNNVSNKEAFPLPRNEECWDTFAKARYMGPLDLVSGYWQTTTVIKQLSLAAMVFLTHSNVCPAAPPARLWNHQSVCPFSWEGKIFCI